MKQDQWTFEVPGTPVPKERPRVGRAGALSSAQKREKATAAKRGEAWTDPRRQVIRTPDRTTSYEMKVAAAAQEAGVLVRNLPCEVWIRIWLMPASRMDLDNVAKSILDGLVLAGRAVLLDDHARIVQRVVVEYAGDDALNPRARVIVKMVPPTGLQRVVRTILRLFDKLPKIRGVFGTRVELPIDDHDDEETNQ